MNVAAHQEKDKNEETKTPVLRSLKGQHGEKMVCERGVPEITGTLKKANSHFHPTQTGSGTTPPRKGGRRLVLHSMNLDKIDYCFECRSVTRNSRYYQNKFSKVRFFCHRKAINSTLQFSLNF